MRPTENINELFKKSKVTVSAKADEKMIGDAMTVIEKQERQQEIASGVWRIFMNSKFTKLAIAAMIIIGIAGITIFDKTVAPAWAIEETIEVLSKYRAVCQKGLMALENQEQDEFTLWARVDAAGKKSKDLRLESGDGKITIVRGNITKFYESESNIVKIVSGRRLVVNPWIGPELFETLKARSKDWEESYGEDDETRRRLVFVTCSNKTERFGKSWHFEFDVDSKLLVRYRQWDNLKRQGQPEFDVTEIVFSEDLPEEKFELDIPEGATVIDETNSEQILLDDPLTSEGMSDEEARAIEEYNDIRQRIRDGEKFEDNSSPLKLYLTMVSCYYHKDMQAYRRNIAVDLDKLGVDVKDDHLNAYEYFAEVDVLRAPLPFGKIEQGQLWPIYVTEDGKSICDILTPVFWNGKWQWIGNHGRAGDWRKGEAAIKQLLERAGK